MKRSILTILLVGMMLASYGQTEKGKLLIGASSNLNFSFLNNQTTVGDYESDKTKYSTFEFTPQVGYFLMNNFAAGIEIMWSQSTEKENDDKISSSTLAVGPFARYYFGNKTVQPFIQTSVGFGKKVEKMDTYYADEKFDYSITSFDMGGGLSISVSDHVFFELGLSYGIGSTSYKTYYDQDAKDKIKGIASTFGFTLLF